jgi:hypothetical protein
MILYSLNKVDITLANLHEIVIAVFYMMYRRNNTKSTQTLRK